MTKKRIVGRNNNIGWLYIAPWIVGFVAFMAIPLLVSLYMSFHDWDMFSAPIFKGLENYKTLLSPETLYGQTFYAALLNTAIYTIFTAIINLVLGLSVAWILSRSGALTTVMRTIIYMPCMVI